MFPQIWNVLCKKKLGKTSINLYSSDFYEKNGYTEIIYFLTYEFYLHDLMNLKIFPWKINFSQSVFSPTPVFHMEKCFFSPEVFFLTLFQESLKSRQVSGHKHTREKMTDIRQQKKKLLHLASRGFHRHRTLSDVVHHIFSLFTCFSNSRWAFWMLIIDKTKHEHLLKRERWRWAIRAWGGIYWPASGDNMWRNMLIEETILIDYWSAFKL